MGSPESGYWAEEVARLEAAIAEMKRKDIQLLREQKLLSQELQAAILQRDVLAYATEERNRQREKQTRRVLRRRPGRRSPTADAGMAPPRVPHQPPRTVPDPGTPRPPPRPSSSPVSPASPVSPGARLGGEPPLGDEPLLGDGRPLGGEVPKPEASSREIQNVYLGLGALLLGVAAVVFASVTPNAFSRLAILVGASVLMLLAAPFVARRGLSSTAETVAGVGLLLVPLTGQALYRIEAVAGGPMPASVFAGVVFAATASIAGFYARATRRSVPRYATVVALQPVLPLLAYEWITGPTGWALALSAVAGLDLYLARQLGAHGRLLPPDWYLTTPPIPAPRVDRGQLDDDARPEAAPEENEVLVGTEPDTDHGDPVRSRTGPPPSALWLREVTWILFGLAIGAALVYAVVGLLEAVTVPTATSAGATLLLAAAIGLGGATMLRRHPLTDVAGGIMTLATVGAASRVAAVALPGRALVIIAAVIALVALGVRALPDGARRGPQLASTAALIVMGIVVAGAGLRAAIAPVRAALPMWHADLSAYPRILADAVGPAQWQLAAAAALLTVAAVLAAPTEVRRELAVAGTALTALAIPASLNLGWAATPWPPTLAGIGIGVAGLWSPTRRAARVHVAGAALVGIAGAGASAARPALSAAVLFTLAAGGVLIAAGARSPSMRARSGSDVIGEWAAGGTAFAFPGAVASFVAATVQNGASATESVLATSFLAVCATLGYAALSQVAERHISIPLVLGTGLGAIAVTAAAFVAPGSTVADMWVGALLLAAALLLFLSPSIDSGRRADRNLDGADIAAAAAIAALVGTLARIAAILAPGGGLVVTAVLVLVAAVGVRAMPAEWRRGPSLGLAVGGGVVAAIAGYTALVGALRVLAVPGPLWAADLSQWPGGLGGNSWQAPVVLLLLGGAAVIVLPRPWSYDVSGVLVALATVGAPAALNLPWWSPIVVGGAVAAVYAISAVVAPDPRAGRSHTAVAAAIALHAVGAGVVRPWTTAAALGIVVLIGTVVALLARTTGGIPAAAATVDPEAVAVAAEDLPPHLAQIGGLATGAALLALPGTIAALAAELALPAEAVVTAALAAASLGMASLAAGREQAAPFLPYATLGVAGGATVTAAFAFGVGLAAGVFAAAAALLGVLAELLRASTTPQGDGSDRLRRWSQLRTPLWRRPAGRVAPRWSVDPALGAVLVATPATILALIALAPALSASLFDPLRTTQHIWEGPLPELLSPPAQAQNTANVLAALLLTIAMALAAVGFSQGRVARAVPVVLPGIGITLLITPISLGLGWPHTTMAALGVFTIAMLGLALTSPPADSERSQSLRAARVVAFVIGLLGGNAGLAGSLAVRWLTLFTLGSAVFVGLVAALGGRTQRARILGWLFAAVMAQAFVLTVGLVAGLPRTTSAFGVLGVGAALLVVAATLPRLRRARAVREAATVEWSGYAAALIAVALAFDSRPHLAGLLAAWGAVLGVAAGRPGRRESEQRALFYAALGFEVAAWCMLMSLAHVAVIEAYTLPFAAVALIAGLVELRQRPYLGSWIAYGPALLAAFAPTTAVVLTSERADLRQVLLLLGAVTTLIYGSMRQEQAPLTVGAIVTVISAIYFTVTLVGPYLVVFPVGIVLLILGASSENRRRAQERFRTLRGMR